MPLQRRVLVLCQHSDHQNHRDSLLVTECLPGCPVAKGKRERLPTYPNLVMNGATLSGSPTKHRASSLIMICNAPHPHSRAVPNNRSCCGEDQYERGEQNQLPNSFAAPGGGYNNFGSSFSLLPADYCQRELRPTSS